MRNATVPRDVQGLMTSALVVVHGRLRYYPDLQRRLAALRNRMGHEKRGSKAILNAIRPGDCVWDVGSNVGFYTRQFLSRVGPSGRVVAFEPVPANAERLVPLAPEPRLTVIEAALAASEGQQPFVVSGESGDTSCIGDAPSGFTVRVARGDSLLTDVA